MTFFVGHASESRLGQRLIVVIALTPWAAVSVLWDRRQKRQKKVKLPADGVHVPSELEPRMG